MKSSEMDLTSLMSQTYDSKNTQHKNFIENALKRFNETSGTLGMFDMLITMPSGLTLAVLSLSGFMPLYWSAILYSGLVYSTQKLVNRAKPAADFQDQLGYLIKIYLWCSKNGPSVTHDENFQRLLKAISPYVAHEDITILKPWNGINQKDLSDVYIQHLSQSPHRIHFLELNRDPKMNEEKDQSQKRNDKPKTYLQKFNSLFQQSIAEGKQAIYAYDCKDTIVETKPVDTSYQLGFISIPKFW